MSNDRRQFLRLAAQAASAAALSTVFPPSIAKALAIPAAVASGTIKDIAHVVILMQENRSFDHYFGTMRGVRGYGDRHPVPTPSGKPVWYQSDGKKDMVPFHLDTKTTSAMRVPGTPHSFSDAQAAWSQGRFGEWPKYKNPYSMGYFKREDVPFQFALAEAFTICDAYHCSITTGTDPNRIVFWSGSNFNPDLRARGENCTDADSEPNNLRCWIKGSLPSPGYTYAGSAFRWPTLPDVLQQAGVSWRIYQNPNDNWTGAMHGGLAFESFRTCKPGSALYDQGMSRWSLEQLAQDAKAGTLPQVSWVLPPQTWSEHPGPSSPAHGAEFTSMVLDALTGNPEVWAKTVFFLTFDENDGQFDHLPPPAVPSYNADGTLAGASTLDLKGEYFSDPARKALHVEDTISGTVRPWGLGPRVPMYVISPWSKGGWVSSQVFDHTSVGQFLEARFGVRVPGISPWHRAVCGDMASAFDFATPNDPAFPPLPDASGASTIVLAHIQRPVPMPPAELILPVQERGPRPSRPVPYELSADVRSDATAGAATGQVTITFRNTGSAGAVFHVYDRQHLDRIPRRYTVEAGKSSSDRWDASPDAGAYHLSIYGPNGFLRDYKGTMTRRGKHGEPEIDLHYDRARRTIDLLVHNPGPTARAFSLRDNAYGADPSSLSVGAGKQVRHQWPVADSGNWYDVTVADDAFERRFASRLETGAAAISDPAMGLTT
jgi:phospholipase C